MNRPRSAAIVLALLLIASGCAKLVDGMRSHEPPPGTASHRRLQPGPHAVASVDYRFVDERRPTPPSNGREGAPSRTLETTVWYPDGAAGARPLLVYAHGFGGSRREMLYLLEHLASHGYVVAGFDFPLTNGATPGGPDFRDLASQPGDVRFVIDSVLRTAETEHPLAGRIDAQRIAALGLSYGGLTTTLVAFHAREADPRLDAAISIAGPAQMFTRRFYANGGPPFLMIAGTRDALVPYEFNALPLSKRNPRAALLTIEAGTHIGFVDIPGLMFRFVDNPDSLACRHMNASVGDREDTRDNPFGPLGDSEIGIDLSEWELPCRSDAPFERAMRPQRQRVLTSLGVRAFLDAQLADTAADRAAAARFLSAEMPEEMAEVRYRQGL